MGWEDESGAIEFYGLSTQYLLLVGRPLTQLYGRYETLNTY